MDNGKKLVVDDDDLLIFAKSCSMLILPIASAIAGILPVKLGKFSRSEDIRGQMAFDRIMSFALHFGAGVLLCTVFLHLLPDLRENMVLLQAHTILPPSTLSYPELIMCAGFFFMYSIEQSLHSCLTRRSSTAAVATVADVESVESAPGKSVFVLEKSVSCPTKELCPAANGKHQCVEHKHIKEDVCAARKNYHSCQNHACPGGELASLHEHDPSEHDHLPDFSKSMVSGLLTVVALSVHEAFEGLAVGLEKKTKMVWYMLAAISCHKTVLSAFIGVQSLSNQAAASVTYTFIVIYALTSSLGILAGMVVSMYALDSEALTLGSLILQGLATGTLLYVVFFEIYMKNVGRFKLPRVLKALASVCGFVFMAFLQTELAGGEESGV